jgi:hypothetical protein
MTVFGFTGGPTYRAATREEQFSAALAQPMNLGATLWDQAKGGVLESLGLGTAIRSGSLPEAAPTIPGVVVQPENGDAITLPDTPQMRRRQTVFGNPANVTAETPAQLQARRDEAKALDEDAYRASAYYRANIPWDAGMTEDRAAALAMMDDAKSVREFFASKRPFTSFIGNLAGQAVDPINYIPIAGPLVKTASVARFGKVAGAALTSALDAAGNTAIFAAGTADARGALGDDVSWQSTVSQIATAALIGGAFGTVGGVLGRRADARVVREAERRLATLRNTQDARVALNEGIDALIRGEDVRLSPNATEPMARVADVIASQPVQRTGVFEPPVQDGFVRVYHSGSVGEGDTGRWVSTNRQYAADYRGDLPLYYLDLRADDPRINNADIPEQGLKEGFTFNFETTPQEAAQLKETTRDLPQVIDQISIGSGKQDIYGGDIEPNTAATFPRAGGERVQFPVKGRMVEGEVFQNVSGGYALVRGDDGRLYRSTWAAMADPDGPKLTAPRAIDSSAAHPDPLPEGLKQAEAAVAKPEDYKALAAQYRVDPESGAFFEEGDIQQLAVEGRLTEQDVLTMADAQSAYDDGSAYGEALKSVVGCLI